MNVPQKRGPKLKRKGDIRLFSGITPPKTYIYDTKNDGLEEVSPASTMAILGSYAAMLDFRAVLPILPVGVRNVPTPTT